MTSLPLRLLVVVALACPLLGCGKEGSSTPGLDGTWAGPCRSVGQEYERTLIAFDVDRLGVRNFRYSDSGCAAIKERGSRFTEGRYTVVGPNGSGPGTQWNTRDVTVDDPSHELLLPVAFDLYTVRGDQLHYGDYTTGDGSSESDRPTAPSETAIATYVGPDISDVFGQSVRGSSDPRDLIGNTIELFSTDDGRELCEYYLSDGRVKGWRRQVGGYDGTWRIEGDELCIDTPLLGPRGCVSVELSSTGGTGQYLGPDGAPPWPWSMEVEQGDQCAMEPITFTLYEALVKRVSDGDGCWDGDLEGNCNPDLYLEISVSGELRETTSIQQNVDPSASQPAVFVGDGFGLFVEVPYPDGTVKIRLWDDDNFSASDHMGATEGIPVSMTFFDPPNQRFKESLTGELDLVSTDGTIEVTVTGSFAFECSRPSFEVSEAESCPGLIPGPGAD